MRDKEAAVREGLAYMPYAPVVFLSALTGQRVDKLYQVIQDVHEQNTKRITTGALNGVLADATARVQPPTDKGRRLKIYYMTQASTTPPHFVSFCIDAVCSTSPTSGIWKTRSGKFSVSRAPLCGSPSGRRVTRRNNLCGIWPFWLL